MIRVEFNNFQYFFRYTLKISGQYVYDTWIKRKKIIHSSIFGMNNMPVYQLDTIDKDK